MANKKANIFTHWHDEKKIWLFLVHLLYSPVTMFTRKKSLGHPVALLKAIQIWIRFRPWKKKKEKKPITYVTLHLVFDIGLHVYLIPCGYL